MKSKDLQLAVKNKYENGDSPTKIYRDLAGVVSLRTIKLWVKMLNQTGSIDLSHSPGRPRTNDRVWAISRAEADGQGAIHQKTKFPKKVMVWLGVCAQGLIEPVIIEHGIMNAERYINEVLHIALRSGNRVLGDDWTYQQDGATPHIHKKVQKWCADHFPSFISKGRWPPNSPDLCPLDYSLWNELAGSMDWHKITTKETLINEIKCSVKKIEKAKILHSVHDFTIRLRQIQKNGRDYIR
ncbi:unnamed protein product [Rotaria magnacalcarata]|uniref:Transposase n=1 Tax=Rotaria magnacalcarata TaxID=392030 RepID=A0A8S3HEU7_9BILA|nr:unnamed protein product [Rotaria magnacalcarata]